MEALGTVATVMVGVALVAAGVQADRRARLAGNGAADMGVVRHVAIIVPWVEIVIGMLLVLQLFEPWVALAAVGLLVIFTVVIVRRLLDGSRPPWRASALGRRDRSRRPRRPAMGCSWRWPSGAATWA